MGWVRGVASMLVASGVLTLAPGQGVVGDGTQRAGAARTTS